MKPKWLRVQANKHTKVTEINIPTNNQKYQLIQK